MKSRSTLVLHLLLATVPAAALAAPAGQDKFRLKPGAASGVCLACHTDFQDTMKLPFVHTPVKAGECPDCHSPHAAAHGKLLAADAASICTTCHSDIAPKAAKSVHKPVVEGNCVKCHDAHAAKNKSNLKVAGNELCFGCHPDLAKAVAAAKFKHTPVEKGCIGCHDPHASTKESFLLKSALPGLCLQCHKPSAPNFAKQH
jgi:DmsE family decaheme c-type cytochrome